MRPAYQQRVIEEYEELIGRLGRLNRFIDSQTYHALPEDERRRLLRQADLMGDLAIVLAERIANFPPEATMKPTVGRKVYYWRHDGCVRGMQPFDATIVFVHSDTCVNLDVVDHEGNHFARTSVLHRQDAVCGDYGWSWMPSQLPKTAGNVETPGGLMDRVAALEARVRTLASFP